MAHQLTFIISNYTNTLTVATIHNEFPRDHIRFFEETLFLTFTGEWFIVGDGGPMSKYGRLKDNYITGSSQTFIISKPEAIAWLHDHNFI